MLAWLLSSALLVAAAPPPTTAVIMIVPRQALQVSSGGLDAVASQLVDLPVRLMVEAVEDLPTTLDEQVELARRLGHSSQAAIVTWTDAVTPQSLRVYVIELRGDRMVVRDIDPEAGGAQARVEAMAYVVRATVRSFLQGEPIDAQPLPAALTPGYVDLGVGYGAFTYSKERPWHHGVLVGSSLRWTSDLRLVAAYRWQPPFQIHREPGTLGLRLQAFQLGLLWRARRASWSMDVSGSALATHTRWHLSPTRPTLVARQRSARWSFGVTNAVQLAWHAIGSLSLHTILGMDVVLNERRFVVETQQGVVALNRPWQLRPWVGVGAAISSY